MSQQEQVVAADVDSLARQVRGPVLRPGDAGYDGERAGFQTYGSRQPQVIVGAVDAQDVRAAVGFARSHGVPVAIQATGHGLPAETQGGVLISTRRMSGVRINADRRTAAIEAGVRWEQVIEAAARHGLAPLSGSSPQVGAISYVLGGGISLLARSHGYAADHVRAVDVVTADAQLRRVTAESDPVLFWALRGAGGNFGVVTALEIDLVPVVRLYGGGLYFDAPLVGDVLDAWQRWTHTVPEDLTSSIALIPFPDKPVLPEPLRGRHVAHVRIAYTGDTETGERLVQPLRAVGSRLIDTLGEMPYTASHSICNDPTMPMPYYGTTRMLRDLDTAAVQALLELAGPGAASPCVVELRHLGGVLGRPPAVANAVGNRGAQYSLGLTSRLGSVAPTEEELDTVRGVQRDVLNALQPWDTGGRYLNFLTGEGADVQQVRTAYDRADYERLTELKAAYDPGNMFRLNHNIPPATQR
ncbi:oxidoreductase [Longimycelium tulufanense]|uniref:Oxidoreductase n=1 Tax=Longimycelium tulufanense TaxID=907463 RepID=A0A8J3FWM8_9PSEU|nr:FAD-binding oxidoreductase [Longimycelium tulufanense]GGM73058.1 oxidoreductase [Longimycelium tulufanense]